MTNDNFVTIEQADLETATGGVGFYTPPVNKSGKIDWPRVDYNKMLTGPFFEGKAAAPAK